MTQTVSLMAMSSSRLLFFFISSIIIHLVRITIAQPEFVAHSCSDTGTYTSNSTYQANLNRLLSSLSSNTEINYGFYNFSTGQDADKVSAIALCRGDVTKHVCRSCVNDSIHELPPVCPNQMEAIGWYDACMLRYSNRAIFGTMESSSPFYVQNPNNVPNVDEFNRTLKSLLANLQTQAASGNSLLKFAKGEANATSSPKIYAFVQCTPDLSMLECSNCLDGVIGTFSECCDGKEGGRVFSPSCNARFETFKFYESTANDPSPPFTPPASDLSPPTRSNTTDTKGKKSNTSQIVIIVIVVSAVSSALLIVCICIWIFLRMRKPRETVETGNEIRSAESLQFDYGTIRVATDNFSDANKLGQGGFGAVYKGRLSNGQDIAVKRLSTTSEQGGQEFKNEVLLVANLQHRNLVRLLGFCLKGNERLLIYEFLVNTSLNHFIFDPIKRADLNWETRYKIIGGIARGLLYLHEDSRLRIIHRDLKASNILLDAEMNPKISDFGTARLFGVDQTRGDTSRIVGTYGYMAPEYALHGHFSVRSDVYGFGMLVLEIVSGQKNSCFQDGQNVEDLRSYAWKNWMEGTGLNLMDPMIRAGSRTEIMRCIHIGLLCVQENVVDRPTMASIVLMLNTYSLALPPPSRPAFFMYSSMGSLMPLLPDHNSGVTESDQSQNNSPYFSVNEASIREPNPQ